MEVEKLVTDIRRVNQSVYFNRARKRKKETKDDYIKRKNNYECVYCHKKKPKDQLSVSVEPYHILKRNETIWDVIEYYNTDIKTLKKLNPNINNFENLSRGEFFNLPKYYKIFPNTHGICFCNKCKRERNRLNLNHIEYIQHLIESRKYIRDQVTKELRRRIFKRDDYKCVYCLIEYGKPQTDNTILTVNHKKPIVDGGTNDEKNLCTSCLYHNQDKGSDGYELYIKRIKERKFKDENFSISRSTNKTFRTRNGLISLVKTNNN